MTIEQELAELTSNFTEPDVALKCWTKNEKYNAIKILRDHYKIVEVSDGRMSPDEGMNWVISAAEPKQVKESLNEGGDYDLILSESEDDFDLDPDDDFDLDDLDLDSLQDSSEIADADQLTVLKARAADLADKWKETYKQISKLAKELDLIASHNDELEIKIEKVNGEASDVDGDLDKVAVAMDELDQTDSEEVDDSFGPSEFDDRAALLPPDIKVEEFKPGIAEKQITESSYPWNKENGTIDLGHSEDPNELYLDPNRVDDDF